MIQLLYSHFDDQYSEERWQYYFTQFPPTYQQKILRYRRWQDRQARLLSYLLLREALIHRGYTTTSCFQLQYENYGRPFINQSLDFNLSHSGNYVVCVLTEKNRIGIDIEQIRPINIMEFSNYFTPQELAFITAPPLSYQRFYDYWTIKESVMKADGRGLNIPLQAIQIQEKTAFLENTHWSIQKIAIHSDYACHLAMRQQDIDIMTTVLNF